MARLVVKVQPRSSRNLVEIDDQNVKVWTTAPPVGGQANRRVAELIAERLEIAKSRVQLVAGEVWKQKTFEIEGLSDEELWEKLR